jgi:hypothetical protein
MSKFYWAAAKNPSKNVPLEFRRFSAKLWRVRIGRGNCTEMTFMPDQSQKNRPVAPSGGGGGEGPSAPKVDKPNTEELLKRMRKVDPDQAKRYRQRTGQ